MILFKLIQKIVSALVLIALAIPTYAAFTIYNEARNTTVAAADVVVVLGAAQLDGRPGEVLTARLEEAKRVYSAGIAKVIFTSGASAPGDRTTEAEAGKQWLVSRGVSAKKILAIPEGRDTLIQTKSYVREMIKRKYAAVAIATDAYNCKRAITMARDLGVDATCTPVKTGPNTLQKSSFRYLWRETGAYLSYIALGRHGIHISDHLR